MKAHGWSLQSRGPRFLPRRARPALLFILALAGALMLLPRTLAAERPAPITREPAAGPDEPSPEKDEQEPDEQVGEGEDESDQAPDALVDSRLTRLLEGIVLIDRPGFSAETHGKLQVQYLDAESDDPRLEDDLFLRELRPFIFGRIGKSWTWKLEGEVSTRIEAEDSDLDQLNLQDVYVRYQGLDARHRRLTLGNQRAPYSRDLMTSSSQLLLVERSLAGNLRAGVPGRVLGLHFRSESHAGKLAYWGSAGVLGHEPDAGALSFEAVINGRDDLNTGLLFAARVDLHPNGPMSYSDGDRHTPELKTTWSVAGYRWDNDGDNHPFTEGGVGLDPERADLDSATGVELSGGLRGRGITLDWQHNRIRSETVVPDFSGGLYTDGDTRLEVSAVEGGYRVPGSIVELGGALTRLDADGFVDAWKQATVVVNLDVVRRFIYKLQLSHTWNSNRLGIPEEDFGETRIQLQYVW